MFAHPRNETWHKTLLTRSAINAGAYIDYHIHYFYE